MAISVTTQNVHTWKKRIRKDEKHGLKGSTYMIQKKDRVEVTASADYQSICKSVLGPPTGEYSLASYIVWNDVQAVDLVELLFRIDNA